MKNIPVPLYSKTSIEFAFWFIIGISTILLFYKPFEQPIFFDRAYLLYMSQVVFRGGSLYHSTTFGYTPLSVLLVASFMKIGAFFSIDTILSARISGLALYGFMCGSFFVLLKNIFCDVKAAWIGMILFIGMGFLQILSGINAEPKTFVLTFSILGMFFLIKRKWVMVGFCFSIGAMCWHVAAISIVACFAVLPWNSTEIKSVFSKFLIGIFLGTLPVLIYLGITNGWDDFWNQAILRKLMIEGDSLGEVPWRWLIASIYPHFVYETGHFIFGFIGFTILVNFWLFSKKKLSSFFKNDEIIPFIFAYTIVWGLFNTLEFQGPPDIIPLLGIIIILCTFSIMCIKNRIKGKISETLIITIFILYNFFDAFSHKIPFTYKDEKKLFSEIQMKYGDPFVIEFEEYYTILEKPMPTKFMRFAPYEDYFLMNNGTCNKVIQDINNSEFDYLIERNRNKNIDLSTTLKHSIATNLLGRVYKSKKNRKKGECTNRILNTFYSPLVQDSIKECYLPISDFFIHNTNYSVYKKKICN